MLIEFDQMPATARTWIYQADKELKASEISLMEENLRAFVTQWTAHSAALRASFKFFHNRFLVLAVDESLHGASGCSIDASVRFIQKLGTELGCDFFDRRVVFVQGDQLIAEPVKNLKQLIAEGIIEKNTSVFNNSVSTLETFQKEWQKPAVESWLKKYFTH